MTDSDKFEVGPRLEPQLLDECNSGDSSIRWAAAISLSEFPTLPSALALHKLRTDASELVRTAATNSLSSFPPSLLNEMEVTLAQKPVSEFNSEVWKSYPLPDYGKSVSDEYRRAVLEIINTEGPTSGGRLRRLLGEASLMGRNFNVTKGLAVVQPLIISGQILRVDRFGHDAGLEKMIFTAPGIPEIVIRSRNSRLLTEIPVNEARAVLASNTRYKLRPNKNLGFEILSRHYEIKPNELFLVGEALETQWEGLFS
jgi:hypothetical protein